YVEMSAPPDCDPDDRAAWRKANASYPKRTPAKAILRMRKLLSAEDFMREALGVWDSASGRKFSPGQWADCRDPASVISSRVALVRGVVGVRDGVRGAGRGRGERPVGPPGPGAAGRRVGRGGDPAGGRVVGVVAEEPRGWYQPAGSRDPGPAWLHDPRPGRRG